jgi:hypothetical protein
MKLDDYLRERGLTSAEFAKLAGLAGKQSVHHYRHGLRFPTAENLRLIHTATKGVVTANDFMDQHAPPRESAPRKRRAAAEVAP